MKRQLRVGPTLGHILKAVRTDELVITPDFNQYLLSGAFDKQFSPEIGQFIFDQLTTPQRERSASFSSSSAGFCDRRQVLAYLGVPTPHATISPRLANIFSDGRWRHLRWQAMLMHIGLWDFQPEAPLDWPRMRHLGHADGSLVVPDTHPRWGGAEGGFELKGVNPFSFKKDTGAEAKEQHRRQVHRYFLMSGWDIYVIIYENKGTNEWHEWVVEPDKALIREQKQELIRLNRSVDAKKLPHMLQQCRAEVGPTFGDCPFGQVKNGESPCKKARSWPRIKGVA